MLRRCNALFGSLLTVLWLSGLVRAEDVQFRYAFSKDTPLIYETTTTVQQTQDVNGRKFETSMKSVEIMSRTLVGTGENGSLIVEHENKRLRVELDVAQMGKYAFNSESTENESGSALGSALTPVYEVMSGALSTVTIRPTGEIVEVQGLSDLLKDALKNNTIAQRFAAGAGSQDGLKMNYKQQYPEFPERALQIGDSWSVPFELKMAQVGTLSGKNTYRLDRKLQTDSGNVYRILRTSDLELEVDIELNGVKATGTMAISDSAGQLDFDVDRGQLLASSTTFTLSGDLTVNAGGQSIPVRQKQVQTHTVKRLDRLPE